MLLSKSEDLRYETSYLRVNRFYENVERQRSSIGNCYSAKNGIRLFLCFHIVLKIREDLK